MTTQNGTTAERPRITVVVSTYRRADRIRSLLEALHRQTLEPGRFEVIMVDNCSPDDTSEVITSAAAELGCQVRLLRTDVNRGPAPARNLGWTQANTEYIAFLDDDCLPSPGWLESGLAALESDTALGVVQGQTTPPAEFRADGRMPRWHHRHNIVAPTPYLESCNIFYRREALAAVGGFDEVLGFWGEDTALGWAVMEAGWCRGFEAEAAVAHDVETRGWAWHLKTAFMEKNLVRVAARNPLFRQEVFWKRWAVRPRDAAFAVAALSLAGGFKWRPLWFGLLPYVWLGRVSPRSKQFVLYTAQTVLVDAARSAGHIAGSMNNRTVVL